MLYFLLSGSFPFWLGSARAFHRMTPAQLRDGIVRGAPTFARDPWASYSPKAKDLVCRLLEKDPAARPRAAEALAHPWFAEVLGAAEAAEAVAAAEAAAVVAAAPAAR